MKKTARELLFADDGQTYAQVTKMLGHCRVMAKTETTELKCKIRGSMQKRVYVRPGDWVLVAERDFSDDVADIIAKYEPAEVAYLKRIGEIKVPIEIEEDHDITFEDDEDVNVDDL
jgi:translation initiation factor 1A